MKIKKPSRKTLLLLALPVLLSASAVGTWFAMPRLVSDVVSWLPFGSVAEGHGEGGSDESKSPQHAENGQVPSEAATSPASEHMTEAKDGESESNHAKDGESESNHANVSAGEGEAGGTAHGGKGDHSTAIPDLPIVSPQARKSALVSQIRQLQRIQEKLAHGDANAVPDQRKVLIDLNTDVLNVAKASPTQPELQAAAIYLLSGGRPEGVEKILERKDVPPLFVKLLSGALAYVKGEAEEASDLLHDLDYRRFEPVLAGQLALVQAQVVENLDSTKRLELLRFTANTLPGTLLEEASLRRQMELGTRSDNLAAFYMAADRYSRRYSNSLYSAEFGNALLDGAAKFLQSSHPGAAQKIDYLVFMQSPARRDDILHKLTVIGVRKGIVDLCRYAASRERRIAKEDSVQWTRSMLYLLSCGILHDKINSLPALKDLDISRLTEEDRALHRSAILLAERAELEMLFPTSLPITAVASEPIPAELATLKTKVDLQLGQLSQIIEDSGK